MNFQNLKNRICQNILLLCSTFINILIISLIYYKYGSSANLLIFLLISFEILIFYFVITSKIKTSSFSMESEERILNYDESKYNKLVDLRLSFIKDIYGFVSAVVFSGILFQSDLFDKIIKMRFVNVSFIFLILSCFGKVLYKYRLEQIKVYEKSLGCEILFENMLIVSLGKLLVTAIMCLSIIFLTGLFLSVI